MRPSGWLALSLIACSTLGAQSLSKSDLREASASVAAVLDDWHVAAAQSEEERYFAHMAPEAVFLGIDERERWTKDAFRKWAHPGFANKQVWNFRAVRRDITVSPTGETAWFDELLETTTMGKARGVGILVKNGPAWQIAHYSLSLPIPRAAFTEVRSVIEAIQAPTAEPDQRTPGSGK